MSSNQFNVDSINDVVREKVFGRPDDFTEVEIEIGVEGYVAKTFVEAFLSVVKMKLSVSGRKLPFEEEVLVNYLNYIVYARVSHVVNDHKCLWKRNDTYFVPAFLAVFCEQIGFVTNPELGLKLIPKWVGDIPEITVRELNEVSMFLEMFEAQFNATMRKGLSKDSKGEWETMSFELIQNEMKSVKIGIPGHHAVIASYFAVSGLASVLGATSFRVGYGNTEQFGSLAYEVINA